MLNIASKSDFEIEVFESDIDHIHFLIRYIPRLHIWRSQHSNYLYSILG